ncbi:MAG: aminotransferase class I/II-fold pyridoxal phosphate-dependent enzyme [Saprospiraceae bacterium]|nr:aminotransferase class I/II-fold pyridoxal phosphate-dependent enzyme [Saprospiraceae bacterium]
MLLSSKLPAVGTSIFTVMSAMAAEHGAINLAQGFPDFDCSDRLKDLVEKYMRQGFNQYAPMPGVPALRKVLAEKIKSLYGLSVDPDTEITITSGATQALYTAISTFIRPDDEVILIEPAYDSYRPSVEVNGGRVITYEMSAPDYTIDWRMLERLISWKTRMIIVNTPHNPTGKILKAADWKELQHIAVNRDIIVLCDEAYEHLVFDGEQHESLLRYPQIFERGMSVFSFGKTLHTTGWKLGCIVAPPDLTKEFRKVHQFTVFAVNTPMQHAVAEYFPQPEDYLSLNGFFEKKRDLLLDAMSGSRFKPLHSEGSYFQLYDYSAISDEPDTEFTKRLILEHGVATIPVSVFYSSHKQEKVIRLCFAKKEETLVKAAAILSKL